MDVVNTRQFKGCFRSIDHDEFPCVFRNVTGFRYAETNPFKGDVVDVADAIAVKHGRVASMSQYVLNVDVVDTLLDGAPWTNL